MTLCISQLIRKLQAIQSEHGDLPCYIYGSDEQRDMPMIDVCLHLSFAGVKPVFGRPPHATRLTFSAILPWVDREIAALDAAGE